MTDPGYLRRTRAGYDAIAADYATWAEPELATKPLERALLAHLAELVLAGPSPVVADVGCGPGRITAHLRGLGVEAFGVDLSPAMIATARARHPRLRFEEGSMTDLGRVVADASLGGLLAWYSIIHVPDDDLPGVLAGFRRALVPGGWLLVASQVADDADPATRVRRVEGFQGHAVAIDFHRRTVDDVAGLAEAAGLEAHVRTTRRRQADGPFPETRPQGFLLARRPQ